MKRNKTNAILCSMLSLVLLPISIQAATIAVTATGDLVVDIPAGNANAGANTVAATGGTNLTPTITVNTGVALTGDAVAQIGINTTVAGYTITNDGSIRGALDGIRVTGFSAIINNNLGNTIAGTGATVQGIDMSGGATASIINNGTITGTDDAILIRTATINISNTATGLIDGLTGAASDGISAGASATIGNAGTIRGNGNGILAGASLNVTSNSSIITGRLDGINATTTASITNTGTITGTTDDGIDITDGTITNTLGSIIGGDRGIIISGGATNTVTSTGTIRGATGLETAGGIDTININAGFLTGTGGNAAILGGGADIFNIEGGALVTGNVDGGVGVDTLNINGASTITGNVQAFESIVRTGSGAAVVNGTTVTDTVSVNTTGSLYLNGNVNPSTLLETAVTLTAGEFGGTGSWDANIVQNGGNLSAGSGPSAVGTLTLAKDGNGNSGNLTVTNGSLLVNTNPTADTIDRINVGGNTSIAGATMLVAPTSKDGPLQNGTKIVIDTTGTLTGNYTSASFFFDSNATDGGLQATSGTGAFTSSTMSLASVVVGTDIGLRVIHNYDTVTGLSPFGVSFGENLNTQVGSALGNPVLADFLGFLDYSDATTVACVMNAYEPDALIPVQAIALQSSREIHRIVEQQNSVGRISEENNHFWGNFNGNSGDNSDGTRFTLGAATDIGGLTVGVLVSQYNNGDIGLTNVDADLDALSYGAYFSSGTTTGWQWNGYVGISSVESESNRDTFGLCPEVSDVIGLTPEGSGLQALLSGAYMMEKGCCKWGPTFGVEYSSVDMDQATITPGPNLPSMSLNADEMESIRSLLGVRAEFTFDKTHPYISAQWAHEFEGETTGYTATFEGSSFNVAQPLALSADSIILRGGIIQQFGDVWSGDIGYLGELALDSDAEDVHGVNFGLHAAF
jgi:hypothetical protein